EPHHKAKAKAVICQLRLGIEQIHLARAAVLEQADDRLRLCLVMRLLLGKRTVRGCLTLLTEKLRQGQSAETACVTAEKGSPGENKLIAPGPHDGLRQWGTIPIVPAERHDRNRAPRACRSARQSKE